MYAIPVLGIPKDDAWDTDEYKRQLGYKEKKNPDGTPGEAMRCEEMPPNAV
jgi:hypothetical protein